MLKDGPRDRSQYVTIGCFPSRGLAELARTALESAGIPTQMSTDDAGGQHPELAVMSGIGVLVPSTEMLRAQEVLGDMELSDDDLPWDSPPEDRGDGAVV